ncbi:Hypothetical Protein FCC1311_035292 [Hondaea fermentalgiana]|uniref:Aldehyde dehydrogenase domain-containing protein n=1 Tax=Hondaea fermentalgiana TaxID=2315210 RepID=A0A2R5G8D3_9STRA|nr:Hypothetical Protein FCC1311_035292 [Hondaea fermentalgiana]|eukprot:GBG27307.1 Hypothetical Protein FCC1311_035292 [Hondaea fermentalgiana]
MATRRASSGEVVGWEVVNTKLDILGAHAEAWGALRPSERLQYLGKVKRALQRMDIYGWCADSALLQGWDMNTRYGQNVAATETKTTAYFIKAYIEALMAAYNDMVAAGDTYESIGPKRQGLRVDTREKTGRKSVHVPRSFGEWAAGTSLDILLQQGAPDPRVSPPAVNLASSQVCVVLGGGSQSYLSVSDILHQLFVEGQVPLFKHHHLRALSVEPVGKLFSSIIEDGFMDHVLCDPLTTRRLAADPRVGAVHVTGSKASHDAILRHLRSAEQEKRMTSQLSCVTPWVVVPGGDEWTLGELEAQAKAVVNGLVKQQACNCYAPNMLVIDADWPSKETFLTELRTALALAPQPPAYYPGTKERYDNLVAAYEGRSDAVLEYIESPEQEGLAPDFVQDDDPRKPLQVLLILHKVNMRSFQRAPAFSIEPFAPVLTICEMENTLNDEALFLKQTARFLNNHVFGSLSCTLIVHYSLQGSEAVEKAVDDLRYGCICINGSSSAMFLAPNGVWGAFPGASVDLAKSGIGFVHNCLLLSNVEKGVLRQAFATNASAQTDHPGENPGNTTLVRRNAEFMVRPNPWRLAKVAGAAMFG